MIGKQKNGSGGGCARAKKCQWHFLVWSMCEALAAKAANVEHLALVGSMPIKARPDNENTHQSPKTNL
jgi:hypothetical protein